MTVAPGPVHRWSPGGEKKTARVFVVVIFGQNKQKTKLNRRSCFWVNSDVGDSQSAATWLQFSLDAFSSLRRQFSYYCVHSSGTQKLHKSAESCKSGSWTTISKLNNILMCVLKCAAVTEPNTDELCSYYQSVRCLFPLLVLLLGHRGCRLSWLGRRLLLSSRRARGRRIHKHFIRHSEAYLLPLVHVQVVRSFICLILPNPNLLCFIAAAVVKDDVVALLTANLNNHPKCMWGLCTARI